MSRRPVHKYEALGFLIALIGVVCIIVLPSGGRRDKRNGGILLDIALLLSSLASLALFSLNKSLMKGRVVVHLILLNLFTTGIFCMLALIVEDASLDSHPQKGLFGWYANPN